MKLVIHSTTRKGEIMSDDAAALLSGVHRVVDVTSQGHNGYGHCYVDVWGGTWFVRDDTGETECTVGNMEKWA